MTITIEIEDNAKQFDAVDRRLRGLGGLAVRAGLFNPIEALKGVIHEFGGGHVPARPWMGPASDGAREAAATEAQQALLRLIDGEESTTGMLTDVGDVFADAQRSIIEDGRVGGPPLSEQAKRNDSRKLIDTGDMVGSIAVKVGTDKGDE